jgi:hypothetical protein
MTISMVDEKQQPWSEQKFIEIIGQGNSSYTMVEIISTSM